MKLGSPEPLVSSGEIWGNKGKVPLEHSKNVLYFSSTLSCHIIQQLRLVVSYLIIDHGILCSIFIFMDQECRYMTIFEIMHFLDQHTGSIVFFQTDSAP